MACPLWVCTGRYGVWLPGPQAPMQVRRIGNVAETPLLDGGTWVNRSPAHRKVYDMDFKGNAAALAPLKQLYAGTYGSGPFYFADPASPENILPPHWADPSLATVDGGWPSLVLGDPPVRGVNAVSSTYTPPPFNGTFTMSGATMPDQSSPRVPILRLAIPPTSTLHLRVWGTVTGTAVVRLNSFNRSTGVLTAGNMTPTITGFSTSYSGATYSHLDILLTKTTATPSSLVLGGMVAKLDSAITTWSPGDGNSGVQFGGELIEPVNSLSASKGRTISAQFTEVGSWLR